jgi:hypothetical protein
MAHERDQTSFPIHQLTHYLDGGPERTLVLWRIARRR